MAAQINWKGLIIGISLANLANVVFLGNIFAVAYFKLAPFEVSLVKGIFQTIVFSISALPWTTWKKKMLQTDSLSNTGKQVKITWRPVVISIVYGLSNALMTVLSFVAIRLLPLSDCVVIGHTAPAFTLLISAPLMRSRISIYKVFFCITLFLGVVLVARPTFLYGAQTLSEEAQRDNATAGFEQNTTNQSSEELLFSSDNYFLGVIVTLACAFTGSFSYVTSAMIEPNSFPNSFLMLSSGISTFLVAFLAPAIGFSNRFMSNTEVWNISFYPTFLLMVATACGSIFGGIIEIIASQVSSPTVVSVVRASEIVLALFVDRIILGLEGHGSLQIIGSLAVLSSVVGMTFSDWLESQKCCKTKVELQDGQDVEDAKKFLDLNDTAPCKSLAH